MLSHIYYIPIDFNILSLEDCNLPSFICSLIRGILGNSLREKFCDNLERSCENCINSKNCLYTKVFYTFGEIEGKFAVFPPPYVISNISSILSQSNESNMTSHIKKGTIISFRITLFGSACNFLNEIVLSIENGIKYGLGVNRYKFTLYSAMVKNQYIYKEGNLNLSKVSPIYFNFYPIDCEKVQFTFNTPVKIKSSNKIKDSLDFPLLWESLFRRVSIISELYCNKKIEKPNYDLNIKTSDMKIRWQKLQRFSNRTKEKMSLGGIVGTICFEGNLTKFTPFFELGKILGVGKNCSMGLGSYEAFYN